MDGACFSTSSPRAAVAMLKLGVSLIKPTLLLAPLQALSTLDPNALLRERVLSSSAASTSGNGQLLPQAPAAEAASFRWRCFSSSAQAAKLQAQPQLEGLVVDSSAVKRLRELQQEQGKTLLLRIEVEGGGCSGFQYKFSLDTRPGPDDLLFGSEGAHVVCDRVSYDLIRGARIEWEDSLMRSAFVVHENPNSEASCGCGSSFTAKIIAPRSKAKAAEGARAA